MDSDPLEEQLSRGELFCQQKNYWKHLEHPHKSFASVLEYPGHPKPPETQY